jgi:hypothetical protein
MRTFDEIYEMPSGDEQYIAAMCRCAELLDTDPELYALEYTFWELRKTLPDTLSAQLAVLGLIESAQARRNESARLAAEDLARWIADGKPHPDLPF